MGVTPDVAFTVFTQEIDAWYRVDRALPDITRTAAIRFEPHLGGRLLDVHDLDTGEGRELGRITVWEPGSRLVFVDNEGTEVEVTFMRHGAGTRVTLTHRGLDALAPQRARALRRSGWPTLVAIYRDHVAPNARPLALAVGTRTVTFAVILGLYVALSPKRNDLSSWILLLAIGATVIVSMALEGRLARRWVPSQWQYRRISGWVWTLWCVGLVVWTGYYVSEHPAHWPSLVLATAIGVQLWTSTQRGPAAGRSLRKRLSPGDTFLGRHRTLSLLAYSALAATIFALVFSVSIGVVVVPLLTYSTLSAVSATASRRRQTRSLGFDPDLYLAVGRGVSEEDQRPELLLYQRSEQPEYSGWWAYASEEDRSQKFVAWSLKDLIDRAPEAVQPLREGQGQWRWDQACGAYRRIDRPAGAPRPV